MGPFDPFERVLHGGEIGLGRISKQVGAAGRALVQITRQHGLIHTHIRECHRYIGHVRPLDMGELADAVDRIVVIKGQQVVATLAERIGLADQLKGAAGVLGKDDDVLFRGGVEILQDILSGALDQVRGKMGGGVGRMRIA